jgi:hypothetical protein
MSNGPVRVIKTSICRPKSSITFSSPTPNTLLLPTTPLVGSDRRIHIEMPRIAVSPAASGDSGRSGRIEPSQTSGGRGRRGRSAVTQLSSRHGRRGRIEGILESGGSGRRGRNEGFQASGGGVRRCHYSTTQKRVARGWFKSSTPPTSSSSGMVGGTPTLSSSGTDDTATSSSSSDGPHRQVDPSGKGKQALVGCKRSKREVRYTALPSLIFQESCDSFCN